MLSRQGTTLWVPMIIWPIRLQGLLPTREDNNRLRFSLVERDLLAREIRGSRKRIRQLSLVAPQLCLKILRATQTYSSWKFKLCFSAKILPF